MMKRSMLMATLGGAIILGAALQGAHAEDRQGKRHANMPGFEQLDANGDGQISREEMTAFRSGHFSEVDTDGDGKLSREEILAQAAKRAETRVDAMIKRLDSDGDGMISPEEKTRMAGDMGQKMFERADADKDGMISKDEFDTAKKRMKDRKGHHRKGDHSQEPCEK